MTKKPNRPKKTSDDRLTNDQELWDAWAKTIAPAKSGKPRVRVGDSSGDESTAQQSQAPLSRDEPNRVETIASPASPPTHRATTPNPNAPVPPELAAFNHKSRRRLAGGRIQIEARIDLHGMRQHEAHAALVGFLRASHQRGFRWVLAITGKGTQKLSPDDTSDMEFGYGESNRGILRRAVPQWLAQPDCRSLVVSHTNAAPHHGGEGAIYIQLRSRKRQTSFHD